MCAKRIGVRMQEILDGKKPFYTSPICLFYCDVFTGASSGCNLYCSYPGYWDFDITPQRGKKYRVEYYLKKPEGIKTKKIWLEQDHEAGSVNWEFTKKEIEICGEAFYSVIGEAIYRALKKAGVKSQYVRCYYRIRPK